MADRDRPATTELSVVIPAFNAAGTIGEQLQALAVQEWSGDWEIVVADNGSTDETVDIVRRHAVINPRVRMIEAGEVRGPSHARNRGVASATGSSVAFCDADDVVSPGWLAAMGEALRHDLFVTGPQSFELLNPPELWGVYGTASGSELQMFEGIFPFGPSANLGIRRGLFERAGGFDPSMRVGEDLDLCLRLWLAGVELTFVNPATIHYRYRRNPGELWRQAFSYGRVAPVIAKKLADAGCRTPSRRAECKRWIWLVRRLPSVRTAAGRARWLVVAGASVGRLVGRISTRRGRSGPT